MEYNFRDIEKKWQQHWRETDAYKISNESTKLKFYVLDMFPYPSGSGLHVGHPLGYIASDIYARFKRLKGYNVLHPMGFDSFGLPAEQYALETGQHPAVTTEKNIARYREQLDNIGFCYDWSREVRTSDPKYYKWTQWIFLQLFNSFYNHLTQKSERITHLIEAFESEGNVTHECPGDRNIQFTAEEWKSFGEARQQEILMDYRIAFSAFGEVNWCEALGTVLANDEVVNGVSERGGYPVIKKKMRQWYLRITEYADRLLEGLERVDFSDAMKEMQRNWIGKSQGAEIAFKVKSEKSEVKNMVVYTTRPDTIFGVDFMVVAPEHEMVKNITSEAQLDEVEKYFDYVKSRSERERLAEVKSITGAFTGAYALNPFDGRKIPIWISEYVLAGYGTGAIMAVPCGDQRDFAFAKHFNIPITNIIGDAYNGEEANPTKDAILQNSEFLNGMVMRDAMDVVINKLEETGIGKRRINYRMRDAGFSRQRYWGEPFPIVYKGGVAYALQESDLPLELPYVDTYSSGPEGESPLANLADWIIAPGGGTRETNTMPGYAGSSWYFLRYMDPHNEQVFVDKKAADYWGQVDLYIGGTEHAVGHLLYSRMWTKALYDLGYIGHDEPYKKLVNQGMIQGVSAFANIFSFNFGANFMAKLDEAQKEKIKWLKEKYKDPENINMYVSEDLMKYLRTSYPNPSTKEEKEHMEFQNKLYNYLLKPVGEDIGSLELRDVVQIRPFNNYYKIHVPIEYVNKNDELDYERLKKENLKFAQAEFVTMSKTFICSREVEKMSKSKLNVISPYIPAKTDEEGHAISASSGVVEDYGADTFRMYEMFLGPVEQSKPWDTKGIEGVHRFLRKLWRLFFDETKGWIVTDEAPTAAELKVLHKTIKKIEEDTERFSFNTAVSAFMVCTNELNDLKCHKKEILKPLLILLTPYAPHISEELYHQLLKASPAGRLEGASVLDASYPVFEEKYVVESTKEYPVSINGKVRTNINISLDAAQPKVEQIVLANEVVQKWLDSKAPKKIIFVKGRMINVVI